jgi:hypothetical protein
VLKLSKPKKMQKHDHLAMMLPESETPTALFTKAASERHNRKPLILYSIFIYVCSIPRPVMISGENWGEDSSASNNFSQDFNFVTWKHRIKIQERPADTIAT